MGAFERTRRNAREVSLGGGVRAGLQSPESLDRSPHPMSIAPPSVWVAVVLAVSAPAQIVVDPKGGGNFKDLQQAIDAAPDGAVIRVKGGSYGPLRIDRSLTILGDPAPRIAPPRTGAGTQPPAIRLVGNGSKRLTLAHVRIGGLANGWTWNEAGAGIDSSGFAEIRILHSEVHAPSWEAITGDARGMPAVRVASHDKTRLVVVACDVRGAKSWQGQSGSRGYDGAPGIDAPQATLHLLDSTVVGGDSSDLLFPPPAPTPDPCPCKTFRGRGGDGVRVAALFDSGSRARGGAGARVYYGNRILRSWGKQPDGKPYVAGRRVELENDLVHWTPMRLGRFWAVSHSPLREGGLLLAAPGLSPRPVLAGAGWVLVDVDDLYFALPMPARAMGFGAWVPDDPTLAGMGLALQLFRLGAETWSRPVVDVVGF